MPYLLNGEIEFSPVDAIVPEDFMKCGFGRLEAHRALRVIALYQNAVEKFEKDLFTRDELVRAATRTDIQCIAAERVIDRLISNEFLLSEIKDKSRYSLNVEKLWNIVE